MEVTSFSHSAVTFTILLEVKYSIQFEKFMSQHSGRLSSQYHVARLFNVEYKEGAMLGNAESGCKVTSIYPYDDDLFGETDFTPSFVTDHMQQDIQQASNQTMEVN